MKFNIQWEKSNGKIGKMGKKSNILEMANRRVKLSEIWYHENFVKPYSEEHLLVHLLTSPM